MTFTNNIMHNIWNSFTVFSIDPYVLTPNKISHASLQNTHKSVGHHY